MLLRLHSISRWFYLHRVPFLPRFIKGVNHVLFKCLLPPECSIGRGTKLRHHGWATSIHPNAKIGRGCNIHNLVIIGGTANSPVRIIIEDRVNIHSGAKVLCKSGILRIGEGSTIGPNAAVESDIPPHSLVIGVPARITPVRNQKTICPGGGKS